MDPQFLQEFAEATKRAQEEIKKYGVVTAGTAQQLEQLQKVQQAQILNSRKFSIAAGAAAGAATQLGSSLLAGDTSAKASAKAISSFTGEIGDLVSGLSVLMPGGIVIKALTFAAGQLLKLFGKGLEKVAETTDSLYTNLYKLRDTGLATASGMSGLAGRMVELGYGLDQVDQAVSLLSNNAQTLSDFGSTAEKGAIAFGEFSNNLKTNANSTFVGLRRLVGTQDELNKRQVAYVSLQTQLGNKTNVSIAEFERMTKATDALSKAFGVSTEELEKTRKNNLADTAFRSFTQQLKAAGGDMARRGDQILDEVGVLQTRGFTKTADGIKAALTGQFGSEEYAKLQRAASAAGIDLNKQVADIRAGRQTVLGMTTLIGEAGNKLQGTMSRVAQQTPQLMEETFGSLPEMLDIAAGGDLRKRQEAGAKATDNMTKGLDRATEAENARRIAAENVRNSFQDLLKLGIVPATNALKGMTTTINDLVGKKADAEAAQKRIPKGLEGAALGAATLGTAGAITGSVVPGVGTITAGIVGTIIGGIGGYFGLNPLNSLIAGSGTKPSEVIEFGAGDASRQAYEGLDSKVKEDFLKMATDYHKQTGEKVKLTSAFRTREDQERLKANEANNSGRPVAEPGTSLHEKGKAIDIDTEQAKKIKAMGLHEKYGFANDVPKDPVHFYKKGFKDGGISDGPKSGYTALLHGLEAIVPLANNRSIPVSFRDSAPSGINSDAMFSDTLPKINESMTQQSQFLEQQLQKSEAMLQALNRFASADQMQIMIDKLQNISDKMNTNNDINSKILQQQM
jgi:hypothetical protein